MKNSQSFFENVQAKSPLVHHITNYVTVNDCANVTLAVGASPLMSAQMEELEDLLGLASSLVVNIGTMDHLEAFVKAPQIANNKNVPVVLDPVGVGASKKRNALAKEMLEKSTFTVIKGNLSEILSLAGLSASTKGVDVSQEDREKKIEDMVEIAKEIARENHCIIAITGKQDLICDDKEAYIIRNGHASMSKITGTGCMSASLIASFVGANEDHLKATVIAVASMGIAGELAYARSKDLGTGSFRVAIIDALSQMDAETFEKYAKIEKV